MTLFVPYLAVDQRQADSFLASSASEYTVTVDELPRTFEGLNTTWRSIQPGDLVEVGWWECGCTKDAPPPENHAPEAWHPVYRVTVVEVKDKALLGEPSLWAVVLTDRQTVER